MKKMLALDNVKKLAIVTFFSNLYFYNHIGTLYQQTRGLNLLEVSSIWSIILCTIFLAEVPTGVLADKVGRKWSVVMALLLQTIGEFLYFFASNYFTFVLIAILAGVGYAFLSGANEALVYDSLPEKDRKNEMKKSMGMIGSSYQLAFL
jgi:MFS family permease